MNRISADDRRFRTALETCALAPADFDHRAHVRLAYVLLAEHDDDRALPCASADEFIAANPALLDARIMLTHYSAKLLFSDEARARFVEPDVERIPTHDS
jgi:hypothetical protein